MSRRERSFDWKAAPDEDDAAGASRGIELWLAEREREPDWEGVLGRLRDCTAQIALSPLVRGDARCREILLGLGDAADMAAVDAALAALLQRVKDVRATPAAAPTARPATAGIPPPARRTFRL